MKLLGLFLIRCVFTKKILGVQKFVKTGTGKNRGFPEHCALSHSGLLSFKKPEKVLWTIAKNYFFIISKSFEAVSDMQIIATLGVGKSN